MACHFTVNSASWAGFRRGLIAASSGLLVLAVAGCGFIGQTATESTPAASPRQTAASSSPSTRTPDGATLNSLLLPASAMPAGFRVDPSGSRNAAQALPQDTFQPVPNSRVCGLLDGTSWIAAGDVSTTDFAQNDYANASKTEELAQEVDAFQPGDAQKVMTRLWRVFGYCRTFSTQANGTTATVSLTRHRLARVGDQAIGAVWATPVFQGGTSLVAIRIGDAIVTVLVSSTSSDKGAAAAVAMAKHVAQRVLAAQQAG
jgi:hypothetical protein